MLPKPKKRPESSLAEPELRALELYLFTNMTFTDIYKMVFDMRDKSYATVRTAAKSLLESADAEVYLTERYRDINAFINTGESEDDDVGVSVINEDGTYSAEVCRAAKNKLGRLALRYARCGSDWSVWFFAHNAFHARYSTEPRIYQSGISIGQGCVR